MQWIIIRCGHVFLRVFCGQLMFLQPGPFFIGSLDGESACHSEG